MGDPKFVKTVARANRGGAYARVLSPGTLQAGQHIRIEPAGPTHPTVAELFEQNFRSKKDADLLRRALASPLSRLFRSDVEKWLSKL